MKYKENIKLTFQNKAAFFNTKESLFRIRNRHLSLLSGFTPLTRKTFKINNRIKMHLTYSWELPQNVFVSGRM